MIRALAVVFLLAALPFASHAEPFRAVSAVAGTKVEVYDYDAVFPGATTGELTTNTLGAEFRLHTDSYYVKAGAYVAPLQKYYRFYDGVTDTEYYVESESVGGSLEAGVKIPLEGFDGWFAMPLVGLHGAEYTDTEYKTTGTTRTVTDATVAERAVSFDVAVGVQYGSGRYLMAGLNIEGDITDPADGYDHDIWIDATHTFDFGTLGLVFTGSASYALSPQNNRERITTLSGGVGISF